MDITIAGSSASPELDDDEFARINIELAAFDGEIGVGQFPIPDVASDGADYNGRQFKVKVGTALLTDGFILDQDWGRGPFVVGDNREYSYSIQDANALLAGFRVIRTRPAETDYARVIAFAALDGSGWDTTWVLNASTVTLPAKKFDSDGGWGELINDLVEFTGKTLFLHDKAAGGRCLHYHLLTNGHTCGLAISDVSAAISSTTFAPIGAQRQRTSVDLDNDILGRDQDGRTHSSTDATSITNHDADGLQHQALIEFEAASQADLNVKTAAYLASQKEDRDTYTCAIGPLDRNTLTQIRVGDLMTVTSAAMGLTASTQRIAHMALSPWNGRSDLWRATLELGAPIRRRARVASGARAPTTNDVNKGTPGDTILGTDLGTEDWGDADVQVFRDNIVGGTDLFFGEADNVIATAAERSLISHDAPVGASHARLHCDIVAERYLDANHTSVLFNLYAGVWGATFPPLYTDIGATLASGTLSARWTSSFGGAENWVRYPIDVWVPVVSGRAQFVLDMQGWPGESHRVFLIKTGVGTNAPPLTDTDHYQITFYGVHAAGDIGDRVSFVAVATGDGFSSTFKTPYPYRAGSLVVTVNGVEQEVAETDPAAAEFTLPYIPAAGAVIRASFVISSLEETSVPVPETGGELSPTIPVAGSDIQDVASANSGGDNTTVARDDHVHKGVHSIKKTGSAQLVGDVTLTGGSNVTLTQSGNDISIASTGGGGSAGWVTVSTDGVGLDTGRRFIYDQAAGAYIFLDGSIELAPDSDNLYFTIAGGSVIDASVGGDGLVLPRRSSDPSPYDGGQIYYDTPSDLIRTYEQNHNSWVSLVWQAAAGIATITSGNTSVTVTPGVSFDLTDARSVLLTPTNNPTNDPGWFWVDNVGSNTFQINVRSNPGASGAGFAWKVVNR